MTSASNTNENNQTDAVPPVDVDQADRAVGAVQRGWPQSPTYSRWAPSEDYARYAAEDVD